MMPNEWLVQLEAGEVFGPFTTEQLFSFIENGYLSGEEEISPHPFRGWSKISRYPEFYDRFLEALKKNIFPKQLHVRRVALQEISFENRRAQDAGTGFPKKTSKQDAPAVSGPKKSKVEIIEDVDGPVGAEDEAPVARSPKLETDIVDLVEKKPIRKDLKKWLAPGAAAAGVVLALIIWFSGDDKGVPSGKVRLQFPENPKTNFRDADVKPMLNEALNHFQKDTFKNYLRAQDILSHAVSGASRNAEVIGLLCLTYRELWPYSYQDAKDAAVIAKATQLVSKVDPIGPNGSACRAVQQITSGHLQESVGVADAVLAKEPGAAVFYEMKAEALAAKGENTLAISYVQKTQQLWPEWTKPYVSEGRYRIAMKNHSDAATVLRGAIQKQPRHIEARILLGTLEYRSFNHIDKARELIKGALDANDRPPEKTGSEGYFTLALIEEARGNKSAALDYGKKAYSLNPLSGEARAFVLRIGGDSALESTGAEEREGLALGEQYFQTGNYLAAQAHFKTAWEDDNKNAKAAKRAAEALWKLNQGLEAINWLNKALKADPKMIRGWLLLADWYGQRYDFAQALAALQVAQKLDSKSHEVHRGWALLSLRRNDTKNAILSAQASLKIYDTDIESQLIIVEAHRLNHDFSEAYNWAARAIALDEGSVAAQSLYGEVLSDLQGGKAGIQYLTKLVTTYPSVLEYRMALGRIYLNDDKTAEAEKIFKQITESYPNHKEAFLALGKTYEKARNLDNALNAYLAAAAMDPSDASPIFKTGLLYMNFGKAGAAMSQFERVLTVNPSYPLAHYSIGKAAMLAGDPQRALKEALQERRVNPNLAASYLLAGDALIEMQQYSKATRELQGALQRRPQGSEVYVKLAKAFRLSNSLDQAESLLRQAAASEPGNPEIYKEQGAVFEGKGEPGKAVISYQKYLELLPNASDRSAIELRIQNLGG